MGHLRSVLAKNKDELETLRDILEFTFCLITPLAIPVLLMYLA